MTEISFQDIKKVINKYLILIILIPFFTTGVVYTIDTKVIPAKYIASNQLLIVANNNNKNGQTYDDLRTSIQLVGTFSTLIQSKSMKDLAIKKLNKDTFDDKVKVITDEKSLIVTVEIIGEDKNEVVNVANTMGEVIVKEFPKYFPLMKVQVMEKSSEALKESNSFRLLLSFISGCMISIIFVFSVVLLNVYITREEQLNDLGLTVLGSTPLIKVKKRRR